jgi:hypothetical protein
VPLRDPASVSRPESAICGYFEETALCLSAITRRDSYRADWTAIAGSTFRERGFFAL